MKIANALKNMALWRTTMADDNNALQTAKRSLKEWLELQEEVGRESIKSREDLIHLIDKHIKRIECLG